MLNLVLGLLAIILGIVVLVILAQLVGMFLLWRNRKNVAKGGFSVMNSMLDTMNEVMTDSIESEEPELEDVDL